MGTLSTWHLLILGAVSLLLFGGKGRISDIMGDLGKGISSFKKGLSEPAEEKTIAAEPVATSEIKGKSEPN